MVRSELSFGLVSLLSGEQGCMATVRSAMCCLVRSHILQQVFYRDRKRRRFVGMRCQGGCSALLKKLFLQCTYVCAKCVCVSVCVCEIVSNVRLWCSHRGASQQIISPLWQGFPAEAKTHETFSSCSFWGVSNRQMRPECVGVKDAAFATQS